MFIIIIIELENAKVLTHHVLTTLIILIGN